MKQECGKDCILMLYCILNHIHRRCINLKISKSVFSFILFSSRKETSVKNKIRNWKDKDLSNKTFLPFTAGLSPANDFSSVNPHFTLAHQFCDSLLSPFYSNKTGWVWNHLNAHVHPHLEGYCILISSGSSPAEVLRPRLQRVHHLSHPGEKHCWLSLINKSVSLLCSLCLYRMFVPVHGSLAWVDSTDLKYFPIADPITICLVAAWIGGALDIMSSCLQPPLSGIYMQSCPSCIHHFLDNCIISCHGGEATEVCRCWKMSKHVSSSLPSVLAHQKHFYCCLWCLQHFFAQYSCGCADKLVKLLHNLHVFSYAAVHGAIRDNIHF